MVIVFLSCNFSRIFLVFSTVEPFKIVLFFNFDNLIFNYIMYLLKSVLISTVSLSFYIWLFFSHFFPNYNFNYNFFILFSFTYLSCIAYFWQFLKLICDSLFLSIHLVTFSFFSLFINVIVLYFIVVSYISRYRHTGIHKSSYIHVRAPTCIRTLTQRHTHNLT